MTNPSLQDESEKLKENTELLARRRGIKGNKSMPEDRLLSALKASENKNKTGKEKIKK